MRVSDSLHGEYSSSKSWLALKRPSIRTDSAEIRRATGISLGTAPIHPVYLRCHLHCRFTWCRSSLLCRRQPTLPPLPSRRPTVCRSQIRWMHRKSRGLDEVESAEAELRQDSIHVAWIQTAVGEDRHKDHNDRWTLHRILRLSAKNLGVTFDSELGMDLHVNNITRSCFYHLRQLRSIRPSLSTDAAKTLVHSLISSRVDYCNSIFYGATDVVVRRLQSVLNGAAQVDLEQEEVRPYYSCAEGSAPLASHPSAYRFQDRSLCLQRPSWPWSRHTSAALAIRSERSAPGLICDLLFEATWLCLEPWLVAMGPEASVSRDWSFGTLCPRTFELRNCRWNVSNLSWKHIYFAMHMPSSAHSAFVTWLRGA